MIRYVTLFRMIITPMALRQDAGTVHAFNMAFPVKWCLHGLDMILTRLALSRTSRFVTLSCDLMPITE